jgi:hypothetical protein
MSFFDPILAALGSLDGTNWVTIGVAMVSAGLSIWAIIEAKRGREKPLIQVEHAKLETNDASCVDRTYGPNLRLTLANNGDGDAHNFRVVVHSAGLNEPAEPYTLPMLEHGQRLDSWHSLSESHSEYINGKSWEVFEKQWVDPKRVRVEISWRQAPNIRRLRKIVKRFK